MHNHSECLINRTKLQKIAAALDKAQELCYNLICIFMQRSIPRRKRKDFTMKVTKDTIIGEILDVNAEGAAPIFFEMGMHCLGCPSARGESVEQACMVHGVDVDEIVEKLNEAIGE